MINGAPVSWTSVSQQLSSSLRRDSVANDTDVRFGRERLQHSQQIRGKVEALLTRVGYQLAPVRDAHLCCGSAGTYSLLQPAIAGELRARKLAALEEGGPQAIATANIGCLAHLQQPTATPVRHWIELVDAALA